jgi:NADPH2:quinone reductase
MAPISTSEAEASTEMMKAAWYDQTGSAQAVLQLGELPLPCLGASEVRVRIHTSGVNPSDIASRSGSFTPPAVFPQTIPHSNGAGIIEQVGEDIDLARIGERVWIWNAQWKRSFGTAAQYVVLPAEQAVRLPDRVNFAVGATLGIPALTAWRAVTTAGTVAGKTLFISGGAGAVGNLAIQIAKAQGATVITTVSSEEKAEHSRAAGADYIINYRTEIIPERVAAITNDRGVDQVIELDIATNAPILSEIIAPHGTIVVYGTSGLDTTFPAIDFIVNSISVRFFIVYELQPTIRTLAVQGVNDLLEQGRLRPVVGARFPLAQIAQAHEAVEQGKVIGNVVIEIQ